MKHTVMASLVPTLAAIALLTACGKKDETPQPGNTAEEATSTPSTPAVPDSSAGATSDTATATVQLAATQGHQVSGKIEIAPMGDGVHFIGSVEGLAPNGEFGFHVHEKGDCSAPDASSAGPHLNPSGVAHGNPQGEAAHHAGDMPNLKSDAQGVAQVNAHVDGLTLGDGGASDVVGKAVVVHEKADDYQSQPAGNSGARVACGVVSR